ncbi:MAG TPA: cupin-like domain-containing protein [Rhizomicrobium sp.]|nr:cupin-like domain-containing protein [Rhizomicrobium sp.]
MTAGIIREISGPDIASPAQFLRDIAEPCRPVILRGLVRDWPVVAAAAQSPGAFRDYLAKFDAGAQMEAFFGDAAIAGKYYYKDGLDGFNFERRQMRFADALDAIVANLGRPGSQTVYIGSILANYCLPGLAAENALSFLPPAIEPRIWLGHASNVSAHYDTLDNIACVIAGHRRFTLYPPEFVDRLYVGPIDNTMAGQPVSLAASSEPDDAKYPLFKDIRGKALVAELAPGDALYLPKLWWHKVEATAPFNGLINYWWDGFAAGPDAPYTGLLLSMIAIAERPARERAAWKAFFDHYVFRTNGHPLAHLPPERHGILGPLRDNYGKIRLRIMQLLRG